MKMRHPPLPRLWLMSDERMGARLLPAIVALPRGSGVIFRHYSLSGAERRALFESVRAACRQYGHIVLWAGSVREARAVRADGAHGRGRGCVTAPVHNVRERIAAERAGAQLLFVSPVFATRSHPGAQTLGRARFGKIVRNADAPVIALGGMNEAKARSLARFGIYGWAAIEALVRQTQT